MLQNMQKRSNMQMQRPMYLRCVENIDQWKRQRGKCVYVLYKNIRSGIVKALIKMTHGLKRKINFPRRLTDFTL
jgi:hypothetical protein